MPESSRPVELVAGPHLCRPRDPLIADAFHRTGTVEIRGRGTNPAIGECRRYGVAPPTFRVESGALIVTFKAPMVPLPSTEPAPSRNQVTQVKLRVKSRLLEVLQASPLTRSLAQAALGLKGQANFRDRYLQPSLEMGLVEVTFAEKPRSSRQRNRITQAGMKLLEHKV